MPNISGIHQDIFSHQMPNISGIHQDIFSYQMSNISGIQRTYNEPGNKKYYQSNSSPDILTTELGHFLIFFMKL